jgi:hypothetical protein
MFVLQRQKFIMRCINVENVEGFQHLERVFARFLVVLRGLSIFACEVLLFAVSFTVNLSIIFYVFYVSYSHFANVENVEKRRNVEGCAHIEKQCLFV